MDNNELIRLAERCEVATGPDRELDFLIAKSALGRSIGVSKFTASLDAAFTLIPENHFWSITMRGENRGGFDACCQAQGGLDWRYGETPALALTAACLRALAAMEGE